MFSKQSLQKIKKQIKSYFMRNLVYQHGHQHGQLSEMRGISTR